MKGGSVLWRVGRRRGFALIAAMGVLAALFILVVAADTMGFASARAQKAGQRARTAADLGECAARLAAARGAGSARASGGTQGAGERSFQMDGVDFTVRLEPLQADSDVYKDSALAFRQGDQRADIQAKESGRVIRASYLVNSSATPARAILLEQKTGQSQ